MAPPASTGQTVLTAYTPAQYAFDFPNTFTNLIWRGKLPWVIGPHVELTTAGRCGGMVFASLDCFHDDLSVRSLPSANSWPLGVPPHEHPLADYIFTRQLHSMLTTIGGVRDGARFLQWSGFPQPTILAKTAIEETKIVEAIDRGEPVVLGLIKATSRRLNAQGVNHQVVCYGYRITASGELEFLIYDPNEPYQSTAGVPYDLRLQRAHPEDPTGLAYRVVRSRGIDRWRGFFMMHYRPRRPDQLRSVLLTTTSQHTTPRD